MKRVSWFSGRKESSVQCIVILLWLRSVRDHRQRRWLDGLQGNLTGYGAAIPPRHASLVLLLVVSPPSQRQAEHRVEDIRGTRARWARSALCFVASTPGHPGIAITTQLPAPNAEHMSRLCPGGPHAGCPASGSASTTTRPGPTVERAVRIVAGASVEGGRRELASPSAYGLRGSQPASGGERTAAARSVEAGINPQTRCRIHPSGEHYYA